MIVTVERWFIRVRGGEGTLFQCHFMNHKSYKERFGTETGA
jgi:hypothetical protein